MVIRWDTGTKPVSFERLLEFVPARHMWVVIDISKLQSGLPFYRPENEIIRALNNGEVTVATADPYSYVQGITDADLSPVQLQIRDDAWAILGSSFTDPSRPFFDSQVRGKAITALATKHKVSLASLYRHIHRYYARGQTPNSLATDYHRCGANNATRKSGDKPRGRPPKYGKLVTNITPEILTKLLPGLDKHYKNGGLSFTDALSETKRESFVASIKWTGNRPDVTLTDEGVGISVGQARYHYRRATNYNAVLRTRVGAKKFSRDLRGLPGHSTALAVGPGSQYQVDATVADGWVVHPWTRKPIGRPNVYLIVDTYSHMVVGFLVTIGPLSYISSALAFEQACRPKGEVLKELELDISAELWPAEGLPHRILADRGELVSKNSDRFCSALDCTVSNTAPYRADAKGIVEQAFRQSNLHTMQWLDGFVDPNRDRGDALPKNLTDTDPKTFIRMLAVGLINRNMDRLSGYPLSREHYADGVEPRPLHLWKWGMENRSGQLRVLPSARIRQRLLPRERARVTTHGITFRGLHFECDRLPASELGTIERSAGREDVEIAFDPRIVDQTFLIPSQVEAEMEPLHLTPRSKEYSGLSWVEVETLAKQQKIAANASAESDANRKASTRAYQETIANASKVAHAGDHGTSVQAGKSHVQKLEVQHDGLANIPTSPPAAATLMKSSLSGTSPAASPSVEQARMADKLRKQMAKNTDYKT